MSRRSAARLVPCLLVAACAQAGGDTAALCPPAHRDVDGACVFDEAAVQALVRRFDQGPLERVNDAVFVQVMGTQIERNVWMNALPLAWSDQLDTVDVYRSIDPATGFAALPAEELPVGTILVHEAVNREEGHGVMVRTDDPGRADERGWWSAKLLDDGSHDPLSCTPCTACHTTTIRPHTDGMWGVPRASL